MVWACRMKRVWKSTARMRLAACEAATIARAASRSKAIGFSVMTWRPDCNAAIVTGAWAFGGVHTLTASISSTPSSCS